MKQTSPRPAEITYTDGEEKTIVFPETNRGNIKNLRIDGVDVNRINRLPAFFGGLIIGALSIFAFLFPLTTERPLSDSRRSSFVQDVTSRFLIMKNPKADADGNGRLSFTELVVFARFCNFHERRRWVDDKTLNKIASGLSQQDVNTPSRPPVQKD